MKKETKSSEKISEIIHVYQSISNLTAECVELANSCKKLLYSNWLLYPEVWMPVMKNCMKDFDKPFFFISELSNNQQDNAYRISFLGEISPCKPIALEHGQRSEFLTGADSELITHRLKVGEEDYVNASSVRLGYTDEGVLIVSIPEAFSDLPQDIGSLQLHLLQGAFLNALIVFVSNQSNLDPTESIHASRLFNAS